MKNFISLILISLLFIIFSNYSPVRAETAVSLNNKFGIHLAVSSEEDLKDAANLVNSSGGDWGYVTLVMEEKDRKKEKWQRVFDQMRDLHLIPLIRLATSMENSSWRRPDPQEAKSWADFLDSLNWVVKNRYVILFNEPNRADEWGGKVDPSSYGQVASEFAKTLKNKNNDFFVMLSGFDAASPQEPPAYEDEGIFLQEMLNSLPQKGEELFGYLDGWASHSYPNHGFVGSPRGEGRNSIKNYLWELNLLKNLGVKNNLPIFITETGWPHAEGKDYARGFYSENEVSNNLRIAFGRLIDDSRVLAVTPFILNYQGVPFDHFSWRKLGNSRDFYSQYEAVKNLVKVEGNPVQEQKMEMQSILPQKLITDSTYQFSLTVKNNGQAIWRAKDGYHLLLVGSQSFEHFFSDFNELKPFETQTIWLYLKTGQNLGKFDLSIAVGKDGKPLSNGEIWSLEIIPAVDVDFQVALFPKMKSNGEDFKLIIYNEKEEPIFEQSRIKLDNGHGKVKEVKNLAIGERYRVVILKPYFLPRQGFLTIRDRENKIVFEQMLPFDFNRDGKFSLGDLWALITNPQLFSLFWPASS